MAPFASWMAPHRKLPQNVSDALKHYQPSNTLKIVEWICGGVAKKSQSKFSYDGLDLCEVTSSSCDLRV